VQGRFTNRVQPAAEREAYARGNSDRPWQGEHSRRYSELIAALQEEGGARLQIPHSAGLLFVRIPFRFSSRRRMTARSQRPIVSSIRLNLKTSNESRAFSCVLDLRSTQKMRPNRSNPAGNEPLDALFPNEEAGDRPPVVMTLSATPHCPLRIRV